MVVSHFQPKSKKQYFLMMGILGLVMVSMLYAMFFFRKEVKSLEAHDQVGVLYARKKVPEAIAAAKETLVAMGKVHGPESSRLLPTLDALIRMLLEQKQFTEAEPWCDRALAIREKVYTDEPSRLLFTLNQRAELCLSQGSHDEAEPFCRRAVEIGSRVMGKVPPDLATSLHLLGRILIAQGKQGDAEAPLRRALSLRESAGHADVAAVVESLAIVCRKMGNVEEAKRLEERLVSLRSKRP
jgi:tetratricopeptide (TPR) repeat protein